MFDFINGHVLEIGSKKFMDTPTVYQANIDKEKALEYFKTCVKYQEASIKRIDEPIVLEDGTVEIWFWRTSPTYTNIVACCYKERREKQKEEAN